MMGALGVLVQFLQILGVDRAVYSQVTKMKVERVDGQARANEWKALSLQKNEWTHKAKGTIMDRESQR